MNNTTHIILKHIPIRIIHVSVNRSHLIKCHYCSIRWSYNVTTYSIVTHSSILEFHEFHSDGCYGDQVISASLFFNMITCSTQKQFISVAMYLLIQYRTTQTSPTSIPGYLLIINTRAIYFLSVCGLSTPYQYLRYLILFNSRAIYFSSIPGI